VVDGVRYAHTVGGAESLTDVVADLAHLIAAAGGYLANAQGNTLSISKLNGSALTVATQSGGVSTVPGSAVVSIEESVAADTGIRIGRDDATGLLGISSLNGTFGYFQVADPRS
jgi:hypothetical protein